MEKELSEYHEGSHQIFDLLPRVRNNSRFPYALFFFSFFFFFKFYICFVLTLLPRNWLVLRPLRVR